MTWVSEIKLHLFKNTEKKEKKWHFPFFFMKFDQMSRVGFRGWQTWCLPKIRVQMGIVIWYFLSSQCSLICDLKIYSNLYPIHSSSRNICDSFLMSKLVDSWERTTIAASQPFSEKWLLCSAENTDICDKIWNNVKILISTQNIF